MFLHVFRSSHRRCSVKKCVLENWAKFTGKHLCQYFFFNKVAGLTLLKKRIWHSYFSVNFAKFLRTPFLQNTPRRLFLYLFNWILVAERLRNNLTMTSLKDIEKKDTIPNTRERTLTDYRVIVGCCDTDDKKHSNNVFIFLWILTNEGKRCRSCDTLSNFYFLSFWVS